MYRVKHRSFVLTGMALMAFALIFASNRPAWAGGGNAYPNGAEAFMVGAAPPPGLTLLNYVYYYSADQLKDGNGRDTHQLDSVSVWADVLRFIWISKKQFLGANYGQHFFLLLTDIDMDLLQPAGTRLNRHYDDTDLPYVIWSPCLLTWHKNQGRLHFVLDIADLYIPLYNEDESNFVSWGRNYWTIEPVFAVTWLPSPKWEISAKFMYDFNTRQEGYQPGPPAKVDRTPGQEFHFDFNASIGITPNLRLGLGGYYYRQVTNDDFHGIENAPAPLRPVLEGIEGEQSQVWALGPGIWYKRGKLMATRRTQWEFEAKNKTEGHNVWFKLIYPF